MVRTITTRDKINAQWAAAWALLTRAQQAAIASFRRRADRDVGSAVIGAFCAPVEFEWVDF